MSILVIVDGWDPAPWVVALQAALPDETIVTDKDMTNAASVEYALAWNPPMGVLSPFPNLKAIFSLGAGVDHLLKDNNLPRVPIMRIVDPDLTARMCEWVVLQVLMHLRQQMDYSAQQSQCQWQELPAVAAAEVRIGIMGFGVLGQAVADKLSVFGFPICGWSQTTKQINGITYYGAAELDTFLSQSDILISLLPLTKRTEGFINRHVFEKLPQNGALGGPVFINAGRGKTVVEADLINSLENGTLKAASLDVFVTEPLAPDHPLWQRRNVIITPHVAAVSHPPALSRLISEQIAAHRAGHALKHVVDRRKGY